MTRRPNAIAGRVARPGATRPGGGRVMQKRHDDNTMTTAADETRAYDVLALLLQRHGPRVCLDVLRYWYVVTTIDNRRDLARVNGRGNGYRVAQQK